MWDKNGCRDILVSIESVVFILNSRPELDFLLNVLHTRVTISYQADYTTMQLKRKSPLIEEDHEQRGS